MSKPNIIVIMTDQQRADLCGREGFPLDTTPFVDQLAAEGVWFNRAYTAAPICGPTRVSFLTGRYPSVTHVRENRACSLAYYERDLVDVLQEQGYATALVGKNHSHLRPERMNHWYEAGHGGIRNAVRVSEEERAFDCWLTELNHGVATEATPFPYECQAPYRLVSEAERWIGTLPTHQPYFLWLSIAEPHNPYQVSAPYFDMFPPEALPPTGTDESALAIKGDIWEFTRGLGEYAYPNYGEWLPRMRSNYCGMLRLIDDQIRRLAEWLDANGQRENTLLVICTDHGDFVGEYGLMRKGPEIPNLLDRIPFVVNGPGVAQHEGPHDAHINIVDLMPTLCEVAQAGIPRGVQGRSLWPLLQGQAVPEGEFDSVYSEQGFGGLQYSAKDDLNYGHAVIHGPVADSFDCLNSYSQAGILRMVRKDDWRLVFDMQGNGQLYNLVDDPLEMNNRYGDPDLAAVQSEMLAELLKWSLRAQDPLPYPVQKYVYKRGEHNYWSEA